MASEEIGAAEISIGADTSAFSDEAESELDHAGHNAGQAFADSFVHTVVPRMRLAAIRAARATRRAYRATRLGQQAGDEFASGFTRSADGRLRDSRGRFVAAGQASGRSFALGFSGAALSGMMRGLRRISSAMAKIAKGAAFISLGLAAASAVGPILHVAAALGAALVQLSGFATLAPGALAGVVAAFATLKVGLIGFSDALSSMDDPKKFAQALQGLAPAAAAAAIAVRQVKSQWKDMAKAVQQRLFAGVAGEIRSFTKEALPALRTGLVQMAGGWNAIARAAGPALTAFAKSSGVAALMQAVSASLKNMAGAVQPALHALSQLFGFAAGQDAQGGLAGQLNNAATAAGRFGSWVTRIAKRFDAFITQARKTGQLQKWLDTAKTAASNLWSVLKSVGSILGGVFGAMSDSKSGLAGIASTLEQVANIVNGKAFQTGLGSFFSDMSKGLSSVRSALPSVGDAIATLAPLLGQIVKAVGPLASTVLKTLAQAVQQLVPAFKPFIAGLSQGLRPLLDAVATGLLGLITAIKPLFPVLGQVAAVIGQQLALAVQALMPALQGILAAIVPLVPIFAKLLTSLAPIIPMVARLVASLISGLVPILTPLIKLLGRVAGVLAGVLMQAFKALMPAFQAIIKAVLSLLPALLPLIKALANVALALLPLLPLLGQLTSIIVKALLPILVPLIKVLAKVATVIVGVVATAVKWLVNYIVKHIVPSTKMMVNYFMKHLWPTVKKVFQWVGDKAKWLWNKAIRPAFDAIRDIAKAVFGWVKNTGWPWVRHAFNKIGDLASWLWKNGVKPPLDGIKRVARAVFGWIKDTGWPWIKKAFRGIGNIVDSVWDNVIKPTFSSLKSGLHDVKNAFETAKDGITRAWKKVKAAARKPVAFVINHVVRPFIGGINNILDFVGLGKISKPAKMATGGVLPGYTPGRDVHRFYSPTGGLLDLSGGEAIMRPEVTKATGTGWVSRMNAAARRGGVSGVRRAMGGQSFATGGVVGSVARSVPHQSFFWGGVWDKIKGAGGWIKDHTVGAVKAIWDFIKSPTSALKKMMGNVGDSWAGKIVGSIPEKIGSALGKMVEKVFGGGGAGGGNYKIGAGVKQWTGVAKRAAKMAGLPLSYLPLLMYRMNVESGGNPRAINLWDSNAAKGQASRGLMQTIPSTFAAYAGPLRHLGIYNPLANIYAAIKYTLARYGLSGIRGAWGGTGGYAGGTLNASSGWHWVGERGPELIRFRGGEQVLPNGTTPGVGASIRIDNITIDAHTLDGIETALDFADMLKDAAMRERLVRNSGYVSA